MLPQTLLLAIELLLEGVDRKKLQKAAEDLSLRYREKQNTNSRFIQNKEEALAYLCMRFPATFAANSFVFSQIQKMGINKSFDSFLDLGSGSGASYWAAEQVFGSLKKAFFLEQDAYLAEIGKKLLLQREDKIYDNWMCKDFTKEFELEPCDVVAFSYSLGEIDKNRYESALTQAVKLCKELLVIIEPGTPVGFERLLRFREILLNKGLYLLAPCPHSFGCPMKGEKWCHFSERLSRTTAHKFLKGATLGYEDEKFCYLVFSKTPFEVVGDRIIGRPLKKSGFLEFELCSQQGGLIHQKVLKRDKESFNKAKKLEWGDLCACCKEKKQNPL